MPTFSWKIKNYCINNYCFLGTLGSTLQNVTVVEGQNANLPCNLPPNQKMLFLIVWEKNTTKYLSKRLLPLSLYKHTDRDVSFGPKNSLAIPFTTRDDADIYRCKALYVDSTSDETTVRLYIRGKKNYIIPEVRKYQYIASLRKRAKFKFVKKKMLFYIYLIHLHLI